MSKFSRWAKQARHNGKQVVREAASVWDGYRSFNQEGTTPESAYLSLRRLYCLTNGRFNDLVANACRWRYKKQPVELSASLFADASLTEIRSIADNLTRDGFAKIDRCLPASFCEQLLGFALSKPGIPLTTDADATPSIFDRNAPQTVRHQFPSNKIFENSTIQLVATDPYFHCIAQEYLGFNPVLDLLTMWWSAPGDDALKSRAAQLYHFDMDRFKFVKFFVYLTDVGPENGPHCYIRGSHARKPIDLLRDERITDREMAQYYDDDDFVELTGKTGTILAVDTRGFHKGKPLTQDDRLIFQIQFSDSLFGQNYPSVSIPEEISEEVSQRLQTNRRCFSNFEKAA